MEVTELEKMWEEFGDIPTNSDDEIEVEFYWWEKEPTVLIFGIGLMKNCQMDWL